MGDLAAMRLDYTQATLTEQSLAATWAEQLQTWFAAAVSDPAVVEANAMQVATVDAAGLPSVRTVLARGLGPEGITFFTNYDSAKGHDLAARPYAALLFSWLPLQRQVRLSGPVTRVSRAETEAYFAGRPLGSQLASVASPQSTVVGSREELEALVAQVTQTFAGRDSVPPPPHWGGYRVAPEVVEFWQGRPNRLHDRLRYRRLPGDDWVIERLAP